MAVREVKSKKKDYLIYVIAAKEDPLLNAECEKLLEKLLEPATFVGRAPQQVDEFLKAEVKPIRQKYSDLLGQAAELHV